MPTKATAQILHCENGSHSWTREPRRGPKPRSCDLHPIPVADAPDAVLAPRLEAAMPADPALDTLLAEGWPQAAAERALREAEEIVLAGHVIAARRLLEAERRIRRDFLARRQALRDSGHLVPDDRSHQQQRADEQQGRKDAEAVTWIEGYTSTAIPPRHVKTHDGPSVGIRREIPRPTGDDFTVSNVPNGQRKGADWASTQVRRGAMHNHMKGRENPATCSECWLVANDPTHLEHRVS